MSRSGLAGVRLSFDFGVKTKQESSEWPIINISISLLLLSFESDFQILVVRRALPPTRRSSLMPDFGCPGHRAMGFVNLWAQVIYTF